MKHSIALKFIAFLLCAASLLAAVGSGLSIVLLAQDGLYASTPEEVYTQRLEDYAHQFAISLAQNYASTNLGKCPPEMLANTDWFRDGYFGYTLSDTEGRMLDNMAPTVDGQYTDFTFAIDGSYMLVLDSSPITESTVPPTDRDYDLFDNIGVWGTTVFAVRFDSEEYSHAHEDSDPIGIIAYNDAGHAKFVSSDPMPILTDAKIAYAEFLGEDGEVIYALYREAGAGVLTRNDEGCMVYTASVASDTFASEMAEAYDDAIYFSYYDTKSNQEMMVAYEWVRMPTYTVTVTLLPNAYWDYDSYTLSSFLHGYRNLFPWLTAAGILIFAITLVYLCCAAGRKPGTDEVRPAALNRLPLDLYLAVTLAGGWALAFACVEGGRALFRENAQVGVAFASASAFGIALLCVGFVFAFAAQFKCPNRWWFCNTLCVRAVKLTGRFFRWFGRSARKAWPAFRNGISRICSWLWKTALKICRFLLELIKTLCIHLGRMLKLLWILGTGYLGRVFRWTGRKIARFFDLLPLTWQWLVTGFILIFLIFVGAAYRREGLLTFSICACIAIILYSAQCFGQLLERVRKMRQGDLSTKSPDSLMGSFKDFSKELDGLAGVTSIAVQQQLKSERMKTELITNVSHDIKTPLTSIINYVDLMKMPHGEEEHELYLEVLDRQSQRLKKLIDDLMEMSKASSGNMPVDLIALDAAEAVNQSLGEFADKLASVSLSPVFQHPDHPVVIHADGRLLWRVLSNVLGNACKYALPGTRLYLDLMELDGKGVIAIKNISREQLNVDAGELMERFVRGDASRNTEGSGLGLNIAKSLVELQQGQMDVTVDGDLFKVTLIFPLA